MLGHSLLEAAAAISVSALLLSTAVGGIALSASTLAQCAALEAEMLAWRQIEHLIDTAVDRAGLGPSRPTPLADFGPDQLVIQSDLDGNGSVNPRSAETTTIALRVGKSGTALVHKVGRQAMRLISDMGPESRLRVYTSTALPTAGPSQVALVELRVGGEKDGRVLLWALPR